MNFTNGTQKEGVLWVSYILSSVIIKYYCYYITKNRGNNKWKFLLFFQVMTRQQSTVGISNTRPTGRMWPAWCCCAARVITKSKKIRLKLQFLVPLKHLLPSIEARVDLFYLYAARELIFWVNKVLLSLLGFVRNIFASKWIKRIKK